MPIPLISQATGDAAALEWDSLQFAHGLPYGGPFEGLGENRCVDGSIEARSRQIGGCRLEGGRLKITRPGFMARG